jgi:hypothetical protein
MKKQIKDLELYEIDFLVAKAEGVKTYKSNQAINKVLLIDDAVWSIYSPTTNPAQAWPIIERERISIDAFGLETYPSVFDWMATSLDGKESCGKTSLEAAMRCRVASVYGDEVEL